MRIGFDASPLSAEGAGIAVYLENLIHALALERPGDEFILMSRRSIQTARAFPSNVSRKISSSWIPWKAAWSALRSGPLSRQLGLDLVHFANNGNAPLSGPCPCVITLHDLTPQTLPHCHPWRRRWASRLWWPEALRRAEAVIVPSRQTARDLREWMDFPLDRVFVVPEASAPVFLSSPTAAELDGVRRRYGLPERFLLTVGTIEPRKNLPRLIEAFAKAVRDQAIPHALVHAGGPGWGNGLNPLWTRELGGRLRFLGRVPQADLACLYRLAEFFAYPSLGEGFGLPNLEAMSSGTPVLTSLDGAIAEVVGNAALRVEATDVAGLSAGIASLALRPELRDELRRRGLQRAAQFSWKAAAQATWRVYESVWQGKPSTQAVNARRASSALVHAD